MTLAASSRSSKAPRARAGDRRSASAREFDGRRLRICDRPAAGDQRGGQRDRAGVVLLGARLGRRRTERVARALRDATPAAQPPPLILVLCSRRRARSGEPRSASDGVFDDYLPHPDEFDPGRLAISVRLARCASPAAALVAAGAARGTAATSAAAATRAAGPPRWSRTTSSPHQLVAVTLRVRSRSTWCSRATAPAAMDRIRAVRPDLVLMDVMLPGRRRRRADRRA